MVTCSYIQFSTISIFTTFQNLKKKTHDRAKTEQDVQWITRSNAFLKVQVKSTLHFISFPNKDEISLLLVVLNPNCKTRLVKKTLYFAVKGLINQSNLQNIEMYHYVNYTLIQSYTLFL